jgi:glutamine amidotransferase
VSTLALIDYGSGNLRSAEKALQAAAARAAHDVQIVTTDDPATIARADRIVLPGVGAFRACMQAFEARPGVREAMTEAVQGKGRPFLGICVGMQLLADVGKEFGDTAGLGWIPGEVRRLTTDDPHAKVPHMGWNTVRPETPNAVFGAEPQDLYFTHSFAFYPADPADVVASVDHGGRFAAAVARGNVAGVQFHPEKSQEAGLQMISRFLDWTP